MRLQPILLKLRSGKAVLFICRRTERGHCTHVTTNSLWRIGCTCCTTTTSTDSRVFIYLYLLLTYTISILLTRRHSSFPRRLLLFKNKLELRHSSNHEVNLQKHPLQYTSPPSVCRDGPRLVVVMDIL